MNCNGLWKFFWLVHKNAWLPMKKHSSTTSKQTTALNHTLGQSRAYNYGLMHTHIILRETRADPRVTMRRHLKSNLHNHSRNLAIFSFKNNCCSSSIHQNQLFCNCSKSTFLLLGFPIDKVGNWESKVL